MKNTLINDITFARARQQTKIGDALESMNPQEESALFKYVIKSILPFLAAKAPLLNRAGLCVFIIIFLSTFDFY